MTHLVGHIDCTYTDLVAAFGPSQCWDDYKSDAEWEIDIPDVGTAYIYNYKDGKNYLGDSGKPVEEITDWHIGGDSDAVVPALKDLIQAATSPQEVANS